MGQTELETLIEQSAAGNRQAQEELVTAVQNRIYYHCRKMLKSQDDAMDATQDILLSMLNSLGNLREPAAFWAWLNRMTSNVCCKRLSRTPRELPLWEEEPDGGPLELYENLDDQMVPDKVLDNEENRRMVVELVEALPEAQRLSVLFYYYDEMSVKEIAEAMETSENTVKSRLHYARDAIRKGVEKYAAEGFKLYGLTPVPFLRYFLQKEAADAAAAVAGKAALAAAAAAAASAASTAGGTVVTAALSKALSGALAHKAMMALAGLTLAGAVAGGVLLHRPAASPEKAQPAALSETISPTPQKLPAPAAEEPAAPLPVQQVSQIPERREFPPVWMGPPPEAEPQSPEPIPEEPESLAGSPALEDGEMDGDTPEDGETEIPEPAPAPEPEPGKQTDRTPDRERDPVRNDDDDDDDGDDDGDDGDDGDEPAPEPQPPAPNPQPDPEPQPPEPDPPVVSVQYEPDPDFSGDYLGQSQGGVHEFLYTVRLPDTEGGQCPLLPGNYYSQMEIDNYMLAHSNGREFFGFQEGETDVRFYVSEKAEGPYELKALVHMKILPLQPVRPGSDYSVSGHTPEGLPFFNCAIPPDQKDQPQPLDAKGYETMLESSDPAVVGVRTETGRFYGVSPGYAEVRAYTKDRYLVNAPWTLRALFKVTVIQPEPLTEGAQLCTPLEAFSPQQGAEGCVEAAYQGINAERGVYAFTATVDDGDVFQLQPLEKAPSHTRLSVSNDLLSLEEADGSVCRALGPGTVDVVFSTGKSPEDPFTECAVIHITIRPSRASYQPNPDFGEFLGRDEDGIFRFRAEAEAGGPGLPCPFLPEPSYFRAVSGDPSIAVPQGKSLYGISPGSTEVQYFVSNQAEGGYTLWAVASLEVKSPEPEEPPLIPPEAKVEERSYQDRYGVTSRLQHIWGWNTLPLLAQFRSSDPDVVCVDSSGIFTTLSPGTAQIVAMDPNDPSVCYVLNVQVEDHFDWYATIPDIELSEDRGEYSHIFSYSLSNRVTITGFDWTSSDTSVVTAAPTGRVNIIKLTPHQPGTAVVSGTVRFSLVAADNRLAEMSDTVSFQVTVLPSPESAEAPAS